MLRPYSPIPDNEAPPVEPAIPATPVAEPEHEEENAVVVAGPIIVTAQTSNPSLVCP